MSRPQFDRSTGVVTLQAAEGNLFSLSFHPPYSSYTMDTLLKVKQLGMQQSVQYYSKIESVHDNFPYCATSKEAFIFMSHWRVQLFFKKLIHPGKKESLTTTLLLKKDG